jgi:hypothetical protein
MSLLYRNSRDPLRRLAWRARRSWRRTARRIVAEHEEELRSLLDDLHGLAICGLVTTASGTVRMTFPGWAITVTGVAAAAQAVLVSAAEENLCLLYDAGRYGRFWWVALEHAGPTGERRRATILGSRLVLADLGEGPRRLEAPVFSPSLMTS